MVLGPSDIEMTLRDLTDHDQSANSASGAASRDLSDDRCQVPSSRPRLCLQEGRARLRGRVLPNHDISLAM